MRRILVLLAAAGFAASCVHPMFPPPPPPNACSESGVGNPDNKNPTGCISVYTDPAGFGGLLINPLVLRATRRQPAMFKWQTRNGTEDLTISMKSGDCTQAKSCNGNGMCVIQVKANPQGGEVCRYEIAVKLASGHTLTLDPIVKIDTD